MQGSIKWVVLSVVIVTGWSFGQPAPPVGPKGSSDKATEPGKPADAAEKSLETLMAQALRNNPDVLAAEAKLREAEAELRRTKLVLALKITELKIAVDNHRQIASATHAEFEMYRNLFKKGAGSESDMRRAEQAMLLAKGELAHAEAALNTTTGVLPKSIAAMTGTTGPGAFPGAPAAGGSISGLYPGGISGNSGFPSGMMGITGSGITGANGIAGGGVGISGSIRGGIGGIGGIPNQPIGAGGAFGGGGFPDVIQTHPPSATMSDKLHAALNATVKVKPQKDVPLADFVTSYRSAAGVPFLLQLGDKAKVPVSLSLEGELQLGAVFQALEDSVPGLKCYVREYGILVTMDDNPVEGAMPLIDFWQDKPGRK